MTEVTGATWNVYDANTLTQVEIYGRVLCGLAETDPRIVALTADLAKSTKIGVLQDKFPQRVFNVGVAEQNLVAAAACLLQWQDGSLREPGLHLPALAADPARMLVGPQRMGAGLEGRGADLGILSRPAPPQSSLRSTIPPAIACTHASTTSGS